MHKHPKLLPMMIAISLATQLVPGRASILLIDFGPTTVVNDTTFSPPHQDGGVSASLDTWNKVGIMDVAAGGLVFADGTTASGVALDLGTGDGNGDNANFGTNPNSNTVTGSQASTWGDSPLRDAMFHSISNTSLVFKISGMAAGNYDIYISGRNTNATSVQGYTFYGLGSSSAVTNIATNSTVNAGVSNVSGYVSDLIEGDHYGKINLSITSGQSIFLAYDPSSGSEGRPFATSLAIVTIPEPGTLSLLGVALLACLPMLRKRWKIR